jgi:hypothetical protein
VPVHRDDRVGALVHINPENDHGPGRAAEISSAAALFQIGVEGLPRLGERLHDDITATVGDHRGQLPGVGQRGADGRCPSSSGVRWLRLSTFGCGCQNAASKAIHCRDFTPSACKDRSAGSPGSSLAVSSHSARSRASQDGRSRTSTSVKPAWCRPAPRFALRVRD